MLSSGLDQRSRVFEILVADRVRGPIGEGADGAGRVVAGIVRERRRAEHEYVRDIPALQILVERAVGRVRSHDGATGVVRALIGYNAPRATLTGRVHVIGFHGSADPGDDLDCVFVELLLIVFVVERHPHERLTEPVGVGLVELEPVMTIWHHGR